jgi:hypothetical protein
MSGIDEWESERATVDAAPDPPPPAVPPPAAGPPAPPPLRFATPQEFVAWFAGVYRRDVVDVPDLRWCPDWWRHAEASILLVDLWRTYEAARHEKVGGMSVWFRDHANPHMRTLLDPLGPFRKCSVDNGHHHSGELEPLPVTMPDEGWWTDDDSGP